MAAAAALLDLPIALVTAVLERLELAEVAALRRTSRAVERCVTSAAPRLRLRLGPHSTPGDVRAWAAATSRLVRARRVDVILDGGNGGGGGGGGDGSDGGGGGVAAPAVAEAMRLLALRGGGWSGGSGVAPAAPPPLLEEVRLLGAAAAADDGDDNDIDDDEDSGASSHGGLLAPALPSLDALHVLLAGGRGLRALAVTGVAVAPATTADTALSPSPPSPLPGPFVGGGNDGLLAAGSLAERRRAQAAAAAAHAAPAEALARLATLGAGGRYARLRRLSLTPAWPTAAAAAGSQHLRLGAFAALADALRAWAAAAPALEELWLRLPGAHGCGGAAQAAALVALVAALAEHRSLRTLRLTQVPSTSTSTSSSSSTSGARPPALLPGTLPDGSGVGAALLRALPGLRRLELVGERGAAWALAWSRPAAADDNAVDGGSSAWLASAAVHYRSGGGRRGALNARPTGADETGAAAADPAARSQAPSPPLVAAVAARVAELAAHASGAGAGGRRPGAGDPSRAGPVPVAAERSRCHHHRQQQQQAPSSLLLRAVTTLNVAVRPSQVQEELPALLRETPRLRRLRLTVLTTPRAPACLDVVCAALAAAAPRGLLGLSLLTSRWATAATSASSSSSSGPPLVAAARDDGSFGGGGPLAGVVARCPGLTSLSLVGRFDDAGGGGHNAAAAWAAALPAARALRSLRVVQLPSPGGAAVVALPASCLPPQLKRFTGVRATLATADAPGCGSGSRSDSSSSSSGSLKAFVRRERNSVVGGGGHASASSLWGGQSAGGVSVLCCV